MVTKIEAFAASDGKLFPDQLDAIRHDAVLKLNTLAVFNHASALAVVENAGKVLDALVPIQEYYADMGKLHELRNVSEGSVTNA